MSNLTFLESALLVINSVELAIIISMWSIIKFYIKQINKEIEAPKKSSIS